MTRFPSYTPLAPLLFINVWYEIPFPPFFQASWIKFDRTTWRSPPSRLMGVTGAEVALPPVL